MRRRKMYLIGLLFTLSIQAIFSQSPAENLLLHKYNPELNRLLLELNSEIQHDRINEFVHEFRRLKPEHYSQEKFRKILDSAGNSLMEVEDYSCAALIYELNTELHPYSWKLYDHLAYAYYLDMEYQLAIKNYQKALVFNYFDEEKNNEKAAGMIEISQALLRSSYGE